MRRRILRALLLLLLPLSGALVPAAAQAAPAQSQDGAIGVRLLDVPVARADDPRARTYIVDHLAPGTTIRRRIEISNTTPSSEAVSVYEGTASVDRGAFVPASGRDGDELTRWTNVDQSSLDLSSGQAVPVSVTIAVPPDAPSGERYGVVWAEVRSGSPGAVTVVNRVGIRIYLSVGPGGEPASAMRIGSLTGNRDTGGRPTVTAQVSNTGGRALDITGELALTSGPGGLSGGPYATEKAVTLRPGQSGTVILVLAKGLPDGPWTAHLDLSSGTTKASTEATLTFPDNPGASAPATPSPQFEPWVLPAVLAALLLLATILILLARRRYGGPINSGQHLEQDGATSESA
ncbi:hypothetical protein AB0323_12415 [Arthrobacter sp. NPDC080031]|uniref:hypothetical protein n=1 Tax=Arthrobacter sp. NPDC080031 TaxID=3155918 RepID=UPI003450FA62